jgi:M6 family metalloprotease-like protein
MFQTRITTTTGTLLVSALAGLVLLFGTQVGAAPISGGICQVQQPDGTLLEVRAWGDEFHRTLESLDGYTVVRDAGSGQYCYAVHDAASGALVPTTIPLGSPRRDELALEKHLRPDPKAARAEALAAKRAAEEATPRLKDYWPPYPACPDAVESLCILIDFTNYPATVPATEMHNFMNQPGYSGFGNNGSIRDFFFDESNGRFELTHSEPVSYYRANYYKGFYDSPSAPFHERAHLLITEALNDLDAQGCDFSQYDCNDDGLIDGLTILYAGPLVDGGLWPHCGSISLDFDGVSTRVYALCPVYSPPVLSVLCHELGHSTGGFPDLYDYGGESEGAGIYCLMSADSEYPTNPVEFSAMCRRFAGWCDLVELTPDLLGQTLIADAEANTVFRYSDPTNEWAYFLIENRYRSGRDAGIPSDGLAIWHVDHSGCNDFEQSTVDLHYLSALLQADGNRDLENNVNNGDAGDLWGAPGDTACTPLTYPNTNWWSGESSGLYVTNISEPGPTMTFMFGHAASPADLPFAAVAPLRAEPNPFNPITEISWEMAAAGHVDLAVYDMQGRLVKSLLNENRSQGVQRVTWNGSDTAGRTVASGVYFVNISADNRRESIKVLLAK